MTTHQEVSQRTVDVGHGLGDALAEIALSTIAQFHCLVLTGTGPTGHDGPTRGSGLEENLHFNGGVATRIEHLAADDFFDPAHESP